MLDSAPSSVEHSPLSSPFQSPIVSPSSSRSTSPKSSRRFSATPSPKLHLLKRANSYKKYSKKGSSKLDDLIRRRNIQRGRSQSDTDINDEEKEKEEEARLRMRRKKKSVSQDFTEKCKIRPDSTCSEKLYPTTSSGVGHAESAPDRKKSLSQILDIRRFIDRSPKLPRQKTIRRAKTFSNMDDIESDAENTNEGPLFQATTMFIPGYDFNTHQSIPHAHHSHAKNFLSRRGSRDKTLISLLEKVQSSPSLLRRGSKDKADKHTVDQARSKAKYTHRCDSSPVGVLLKEHNIKHGGMKSKTECRSENCISEFLSVSERSAIIAQKHKTFHEPKKTKYLEPKKSESMLKNGNVKKISINFENGSIFNKNETKKNGKNDTAKFNPKRYSGEYDNIVRMRTQSFETGEIFRNQDSFDSEHLPLDICINGSESGYASPTDSSLSETSAPPQINIVLQDTDYSDSFKKQSRRKGGDWSQQFDNKHLLSPNVKRTNLCVTEL